MGLALPGGRPRTHLIRDGYLIEAASIAELARKLDVPADALGASIAEMNQAAADGIDAGFGKGSSEYNRYYGDPAIAGNPCLGAIAEQPFYAVRVYPGDIGTASGLLTDPDGRVLDGNGEPIAGLYCCGSDMASIMGGHYPGAGITLGPALTFGYRIGRMIDVIRSHPLERRKVEFLGNRSDQISPRRSSTTTGSEHTSSPPGGSPRATS
ncbi:MAG: FAD-binding protein [Phreatobacter sp.]|uniref:FAD-binding protein n=1 Tax=Phreatobacter sp. TaxID=1966341 RepID=UPI0027346FD4|nr:FAD-binding protein [Phreatobacter sp.]MDP2801454.1 FAD-binding protein [Phreatobacter sp.]